MPNESASQRRARQDREDRDRCHEAAARIRRWTSQDRYAGFRSEDDGWHYAAVLESAGLALTELPVQHRRAVMAAVAHVLDDSPEKPGPVTPLTKGPGH